MNFNEIVTYETFVLLDDCKLFELLFITDKTIIGIPFIKFPIKRNFAR